MYVLVTDETLEENLLATLSSKRELFEAVLDPDSDVEAVDVVSNVEELRSRLELLLGTKPSEPVSEVEQRRRDAELAGAGRAERVSEAFGALVSAAFAVLGEMLPSAAGESAGGGRNSPTNGRAERLRAQLLDSVEADAQGRPQVTITLPDKASLEALAGTLVKLLDSTAP